MRAAVAAIALAPRCSRCNVAAGQAADECKGLQVCIPVAGPVGRDPGAGEASATATWQLVCPEGVVGGVDAQASETARRRRVPRAHRQPRQPRHHDDEVARLHRAPMPAGARRADELPAVHRLHPGGGGGPRTPTSFVPRADDGQARRADHRARRGRSHVDAGAGSRARRSRCQPGERLLRAAHSVGLYTPDVPTQRAARRRARRARAPRRHDPRQRDAARPAPTGRARRRAGAGGVRAVRLDWPLALLALLLVPLARARVPRASSGGGPATPIHYTNIEVLASVARRGSRWRSLLPPVLALLALTCAHAALARPEVRVSVAERAGLDRARASTCRARCPPRTSSRRGSAPRRRRSAASSTSVPAKYRVGLVTFSSEPYVASPLTHDHQLVLRGRCCTATYVRPGTAIGDALARSVELLQPVAAMPTARRRRRVRRCAAARRRRSGRARSRRSCCSRTAPRRAARWRRSRARRAPSRTASRSTRSRSARRTASLNRGGFSRPGAARSRRRCAQIAQAHRRRVLRDASDGAPERRLRGPRLAPRAEDGVARAELRSCSALAALLALAAGALSLLWVQRLP